MERRAGKFRALLMLSAVRRPALARALHELLSLIEAAPLRNRVRWHLDIDPEEVG
jgi:primosomal protein N' (replication factor Y)